MGVNSQDFIKSHSWKFSDDIAIRLVLLASFQQSPSTVHEEFLKQLKNLKALFQLIGI